MFFLESGLDTLILFFECFSSKPMRIPQSIGIPSCQLTRISPNHLPWSCKEHDLFFLNGVVHAQEPAEGGLLEGGRALVVRIRNNKDLPKKLSIPRKYEEPCECRSSVNDEKVRLWFGCGLGMFRCRLVAMCVWLCGCFSIQYSCYLIRCPFQPNCLVGGDSA